VKNRRLILNVLVASSVVMAMLFLFQTNIFAFAWHLRHGFYREFNGIRFAVPLFYQEAQGSTLNEFSIIANPSPIHKKHAFITVSFPPWTTDRPLRPMSPEDAGRIGMTLAGERDDRFGNRAGKCVEYTQNRMALDGQERPSGLQPIWITCRFGEVDVDFDGSRNAVPEFYFLMESANEVKN